MEHTHLEISPSGDGWNSFKGQVMSCIRRLQTGISVDADTVGMIREAFQRSPLFALAENCKFPFDCAKGSTPSVEAARIQNPACGNNRT
jgi:hypothetical protein